MGRTEDRRQRTEGETEGAFVVCRLSFVLQCIMFVVHNIHSFGEALGVITLGFAYLGLTESYNF